MTDGNWVYYPYGWEILTEVRERENQKKAIEKAGQLYEKQKRRKAEKKVRADHGAKGARQQDNQNDAKKIYT